MVNDSYKLKVSALVEKAKEKGLVKKYSEYSKTKEAKKIALSDKEVAYYTSNNGGKK